MNLITERDVIRGVADRWAKQYGTKDFLGDAEKQGISQALKRLEPETATAEQVNAVIGNSSWTALTCDECRNDVKVVMMVGEEPDYESHTASLCMECIKKASEIVNAQAT